MNANGSLSASGTADRAATVLVGVLSAFTVLLHLLTAGRYGIFRDELYYIACARHLAFGYVDHPPLIALTTWAVLHSLGSSLLALRMLPALAAGVLVWLTAQLAREMGGGGFAQSMAAFAIVPVPIYLILHHWLTMNAFEPLFWMGVVWAALRMVRRQQPQYWLVIGALVGLGLENKYSMLLPAVGLLLGMLLTPERQWLKSRWFAVAALLALLLFLPNFLWLVRNHFPFLEFERHSRASGSRILRGPLEFLADQALIMNPVLAPLASAGLLWLVFSKSARMFRFAGWTAFFVLTVLMVVQAKNYYAAPVYPVLFAAGAIALEKATEVQLGWIRPACASLLLFSGILLAPLVMPLLSVPHFLAYSRLWHGFTPVRFEALPVQPLPQYFADEFGWEDMVRVTAKVFAILPAEERRRTAIFANNYGEAAAIDFFGPAYGLPAAIGKNETYWLWGPRDYTGSTVIVLGSDGVGDREVFRSVEVVGRVDNPYSRENEHFDVFLCRGLKVDFPALWQRLKAW